MLNGDGPQEKPAFYDHPYFAQIFLSSMFSLIGYPTLYNPIANLQSIENLYLVPRMITIILSILDTWLLFKISEYRYNRRVAFIACIFFAVTPLSSYLRRASVRAHPASISFVIRSLRSIYTKIHCRKETCIHNNVWNIYGIVHIHENSCILHGSISRFSNFR